MSIDVGFNYTYPTSTQLKLMAARHLLLSVQAQQPQAFYVLLKLGADGVALVSRNALSGHVEVEMFAALPLETGVANTSGAGDSMVGAIAWYIASQSQYNAPTYDTVARAVRVGLAASKLALESESPVSTALSIDTLRNLVQF